MPYSLFNLGYRKFGKLTSKLSELDLMNWIVPDSVCNGISKNFSSSTEIPIFSLFVTEGENIGNITLITLTR
jgi:hypothetical protein